MKPIIIVPYRDREQHLMQFLHHANSNQIMRDMRICIVEQQPGKPFNRGKLLNIGFLHNYEKYTHYIFHDIDMLPVDVPYLRNPTWPVLQLAGSSIQLMDYLGGVTRFTWGAFVKSGGYNNEYYHRAEDNEMRFNLKRLGITVINKFGKYKTLDHERQGPEFDPALWHKAQQMRAVQNQLSICQYEVIQTKEIDNVRHIEVKV